MKRSAGFTLLEVLIAVFILALMSMIIWQITNNTYRGTAKAAQYDDIYQGGRMALKRFGDDVSMAFLVGPLLQGKLPDGSIAFEPSFVGEESGDNDKLNFVSFSNQRLVMNERVSDQVEIGYYVADCPDSEEKISCLFRRSSPVIDKDLEQGGAAFPIAKNIKRFNIEYYDKAKEEWKTGWSSKDPAYLNKLPKAVRMSLSFPDPRSEDEELLFISTVELPLSAAPIDF